MTTLHDFGGVLGWPLDTFLLGSNNVMVTALWLVCEVALICLPIQAYHLFDEQALFAENWVGKRICA